MSEHNWNNKISIINGHINNCDDKIGSGPLGVQLMSATNEITPSVIALMSSSTADTSNHKDTHHRINSGTKAEALPLRHLAPHHLRLSDGALFKHSLERMPSTRGPTAETESPHTAVFPPAFVQRSVWLHTQLGWRGRRLWVRQLISVTLLRWLLPVYTPRPEKMQQDSDQVTVSLLHSGFLLFSS